ncbi:MAG: hypothetical protein U0X20_00540 [Caldilineaceae bacterium]
MQIHLWKNYRRPALSPQGVASLYLPLTLCCVLLVAGFSVRAHFASAPAGLDEAAYAPLSTAQQPVWNTEGTVTMYGGAYTIVVGPLRFEPVGAAPSHRKLVADLLYNNLSPFVVHVERNSQIQALVFAGDGSRLGTFVAGIPDLPPGGAVQVPMSLGRGYLATGYADKQLSVVFTDAGGNLAGRMTVSLEE